MGQEEQQTMSVLAVALLMKNDAIAGQVIQRPITRVVDSRRVLGSRMTLVLRPAMTWPRFCSRLRHFGSILVFGKGELWSIEG